MNDNFSQLALANVLCSIQNGLQIWKMGCTIALCDAMSAW